MAWGTVELEPEVAQWLAALDDKRWAQALMHLDLLEERGVLLGDPYTRQLDGKLRELRFYCGEQRVRVTYWIAAGRRIIMLTVFTKTRMREVDEIERARRALERCRGEGHTTDEDEEAV
ncbi:type II toxin-antitoxin system RelE/ParE family toxin [Streptomyces sp. HPF1205]|uniref:type II toxin-antitoxin system RelE/ParE family toxin n=1 Tax=Streptomyces sp. HPF1205 TaxID=2873262 RepID=UPI001CECC97E|nr:type II toxin-antitoxin system RelE/ParE family toxin [Streptomyces sp. HPF1205]